jgi:hypothetical protein
MIKNNFIIGIFATNTILWVSYIYFLRGETNMLDSELWNKILLKDRMPMLIMASIAYILNILLAIYLYMNKYIQTTSLQILFISYIAYYLLQLLFIPLLQQYTHFHLIRSDKQSRLYQLLVQLLLVIVVIPMGIIMVYGVQESIQLYKKNNKILAICIAICSILPFLHVLINDAYRFAFFF